MVVINVICRASFFAVLVTWSTGGLLAAVLPEDRADVMYHSYDGGGVEVNGPAVLVRKGFRQNFSLSASYYQDSPK